MHVGEPEVPALKTIRQLLVIEPAGRLRGRAISRFAVRGAVLYQSSARDMSEPTVAVIGASLDRRKFGNKAVRAYLEYGYRVFPVNPSETTIEGLPTYPNVEAIAEPIDFISLYVPPAVGLKLLPAIAAKNPRELWLNPGSESDELLEAAADLKLRTVAACSIVALGMSPSQFPDR